MKITKDADSAKKESTYSSKVWATKKKFAQHKIQVEPHKIEKFTIFQLNGCTK